MKRAVVLSLYGLVVTWLVCGSTAEAKPRPAASPQTQKVLTMWDCQKDLGLTDAQVKELKATVTDLAKYLGECQKRLASNERQIQTLIAAAAEIEKIRPYLKSNADIQVEMRLADIKASQKLNTILTPAQLGKWRELQRRMRSQATPVAAPAVPPPSTSSSADER